MKYVPSYTYLHASSMLSFSTRLFLAITLNACIIIAQASPDASGLSLKCRVHIMNDLSNNDEPLIIHCHSNDDDLGEHTLWMKNEFSFQFRENVWRYTHFWCSMRILNSKETTVDVYRAYHETDKCQDTGNCFWSVREDGFYFSNDQKSWEKRYNWPWINEICKMSVSLIK